MSSSFTNDPSPPVSTWIPTQVTPPHGSEKMYGDFGE